MFNSGFWSAASCTAAAIMSRLFERCRQVFKEPILVCINTAILCFSSRNERLGGGDTPILLPRLPRTLNPKELWTLVKTCRTQNRACVFTVATFHAVRAKLQHKAQDIKILVIGNWSWTHQWQGNSQSRGGKGEQFGRHCKHWGKMASSRGTELPA